MGNDCIETFKIHKRLIVIFVEREYLCLKTELAILDKIVFTQSEYLEFSIT